MIESFFEEDEVTKAKLSDHAKGLFIKEANDDWERFTRQTTPARELSREGWQLYLENRPAGSDYISADAAAVGGAQIRAGAINQAVDSVHAQLQQALFPSDEKFFTGSAENAFTRQFVDLYQGYRTKRFTQDNLLMNVFKDLKCNLIDGTSAVAVPFVRKKKKKASYEFPKKLGIPLRWKKPQKKMKEQIVYEGTPFVPIMFDDWRCDPTVENLEDTPFIYRRWMRKEQIKAIDVFENTDEINDNNFGSIDDQYIRSKYRYNGIIDDKENVMNIATGMVPLYEKWGDFYHDGKAYENHVLVWSGEGEASGVFHYFGPNPYDHQEKPFIVSPCVPVPGSLYGLSNIKTSIPLAHTLDTLWNMSVDIGTLVASPGWKYLANDAALMEYFGNGPASIRPGEAIPMKDLNNLLPLVTPSLQGLTIFPQLMQNIKEEIRESTGGVPYTTGGADKQDQQRTLGEVQILAAGTSTRFQNMLNFFEQCKLEPYLQICFENDRQFMSESVFVDNFKEPLTPNMVKQMDFSWKVTGSKAVMDRNKQLSDMSLFLTNLLPALIQGGIAKLDGTQLVVNAAKAVEKLTEMSDLPGSEDYITVVNPQEVAPEQEQQAALAPQLGGQMNGAASIQPPQPGPAPQAMAGPNGVPGLAGPLPPLAA